MRLYYWLKLQYEDFKEWLHEKWYGYPRWATWSWDCWITEKGKKPFRKYIELNNSYHPDFSPEAWKEVLQNILFSLEHKEEDSPSNKWYKEYQRPRNKGKTLKEILDDTIRIPKSVTKADIEYWDKVDKGFELMGKHFRSLWD